MKSKITLNTIGRYVDQKAMELLENGESDGYWQAFHQVLDGNPELKTLYAGLVTPVVRGPEIKSNMATGQAAGSDLDKLTRDFMRQMNIDDYEWALKQVMKANPHLTKKYAQS